MDEKDSRIPLRVRAAGLLLAFAAVRCRDVVAPGYRVAYMIPWFLFFGCVCVGAYFHTGVTAIALAILAGTFFIPLNFLEGASRGGPK